MIFTFDVRIYFYTSLISVRMIVSMNTCSNRLSYFCINAVIPKYSKTAEATQKPRRPLRLRSGLNIYYIDSFFINYIKNASESERSAFVPNKYTKAQSHIRKEIKAKMIVLEKHVKTVGN